MTKKINIEVPVLIVGGGGAGLTASVLLSKLGVGTLLVNRYPETTRLPRGHILNQRTMEIFTDMGVAPDVLAKSAPPENMRGEGWYSGLGGGGPADGHGRRVGFVEGWGGGFSDPDYLAASACASTNLSLLNVEPILRAHAERHPKATVRFHQELVDLEQDADGVTSRILDCGSGETYTVRSAYLLGADAGRTVGDLVGITVDRSPKVRKLTSIHMSADLSPYLQEADDAVLLFIINPEHPEHLDFGGVLIPQGPRWGRYSEGWVLAVSGDHLDISKPEDMLRRAREVLGIPDLDATIHRASEWHVESLLADEFQAGRVFLLGDAAHKIPPVGGLGLNSAVHDAYNLCWKLAMVHAGRAGDSLLDTYTVERRPVNQANSEASNRGWAAQAGMTEALGVSPDKSVEENWSALRMFWEDVPGAAERRHAFTKWASGKTLELRQHNTDFGYAYDSVAIVGDGTPAPAPVDDVRLYQPGTRPGQPLPHAWVEHAGERVALRSLIHGGHFALIAGEDGQEWVEAAAKIAEQRHIPLRTARVGLGDVDLVDVRLAWLKQREISRTGAVLVRPDGHIGFRSFAAVEDPLNTLAAVFTDILHTTTVE